MLKKAIDILKKVVLNLGQVETLTKTTNKKIKSTLIKFEIGQLGVFVRVWDTRDQNHSYL